MDLKYVSGSLVKLTVGNIYVNIYDKTSVSAL